MDRKFRLPSMATDATRMESERNCEITTFVVKFDAIYLHTWCTLLPLWWSNKRIFFGAENFACSEFFGRTKKKWFSAAVDVFIKGVR